MQAIALREKHGTCLVQRRQLLHEAILDEIAEGRVSSSRGRSNPRAVKRKVSKFPTRSRAKQGVRRIFLHVEIV
jgi:hypothetical protein